jgi:2-polyprenyl-3-methyl-5-hydroxy-6-metoxy-1,4-benzoquinol methylase
VTVTRSTIDETTTAPPVADGHYAKKQLRCRSSVIAFSHRARFNMAVALAGEHHHGRLLDYGSGDGTFLSLVASRFGSCVGADIAPDAVDDCRQRFAAFPNVRFCEIASLDRPEHRAAYDVVTCMEVLEHCPEPSFTNVLNSICRLVAPDGRVIISVPIEVGPAFLLKYAVRTVAGWRGLSDYRHYERYPIADALRMIFATGNTALDRPTYNEGDATIHSHYGFNWRYVERRLREVLTVERTLFSPFNLLGGFFSSQAWLICRPR